VLRELVQVGPGQIALKARPGLNPQAVTSASLPAVATPKSRPGSSVRVFIEFI